MLKRRSRMQRCAQQESSGLRKHVTFDSLSTLWEKGRVIKATHADERSAAMCTEPFSGRLMFQVSAVRNGQLQQRGFVNLCPSRFYHPYLYVSDKQRSIHSQHIALPWWTVGRRFSVMSPEGGRHQLQARLKSWRASFLGQTQERVTHKSTDTIIHKDIHLLDKERVRRSRRRQIEVSFLFEPAGTRHISQQPLFTAKHYVKKESHGQVSCLHPHTQTKGTSLTSQHFNLV